MIGTDSRISPKFLNADPASGQLFQKDILNLVYFTSFLGLLEVADYWECCDPEYSTAPHCSVMVQKPFGTVTGKRLAILVLPSRPTPTTLATPAIRIYDPGGRGAVGHSRSWCFSRWPDQTEAALQLDA